MESLDKSQQLKHLNLNPRQVRKDQQALMTDYFPPATNHPQKEEENEDRLYSIRVSTACSEMAKDATNTLHNYFAPANLKPCMTERFPFSIMELFLRYLPVVESHRILSQASRTWRYCYLR